MSGNIGVIGGGLAGLSAAVFLNEKGFNVHLFESTPKLGGRTYSWLDKESNEYIDNGQHILAGWYKNTFDYLDIIGSRDLLTVKKNLDINYFDTNKDKFNLIFPNFSAPQNIISGLLRFNKFDLKDKFAVINLRKLNKDISYFNKLNNAKEILEDLKQTNNLIKYFWEPIIYSVFNTNTENVAPELFLKIFRMSLESKKNLDLLIPNCDLNKIFIDPAEKYFETNDIGIHKNTRIENINIKNNLVTNIITENGDSFSFDYYISAVPFYAFKKLFAFDDFNKYFVNTDILKASAIISVHIFFEKDIDNLIPDFGPGQMAGMIGSTAQWIFKKNSKHISLVISGADFLKDGLSEISNENIFRICTDDLHKCFSEFDKADIKGYKVIKEKRATFIPDKESFKYRIPGVCGVKNLFIAGDWTDTGLPSTIESAILSARKCANAISK